MLSNVKRLFKKMQDAERVSVAFDYQYNACKCVVLFSDNTLSGNDPSEIVSIVFIDRNDISRFLESTSNGFGIKFNGGANGFRSFFRINPYQPNTSDIIKSFMAHFDRNVPQHLSPTSDEMKDVLRNYVSNSDPEDPKALYLFSIRHNGKTKDGKQMRRTYYNEHKTIILYPEIYKFFKDIPEVSFCYTTDPSKEVAEPEAILKLGGLS